MTLESIIARRYLFRKDKTPLFSLLTLVGIGGVAIGVFALIVIQAVMAGFSQDLRTKLLRFSPPVILKPLKVGLFSGKQAPSLPSDSRIEAIFPYLETEVILHTPDDSTQGVKLKGVETHDPMIQNKVKVNWVEGFGASDLLSKEGELPGIVLGSELTKRLNLLPVLTEEVDLIYPFGEVDPTGEMHPKKRRFRVIGTFKSGYYEYDNKFAIVALPEARRLVPSEEVPTEWGIWLKDFFDAQPLSQNLSSILEDSFQVETWARRNQKLFGALKLERMAMFLVLGLMMVIATFNIFSLTMMTVVDKEKEIAVLRSLGLTKRRVKKIFSQTGLLIGFLGASVGLIFGLLLVLCLKWWPIHLPSSYYLEFLPVKVEPLSIFLVVLLAPLLTFLASWYPAQRGGRFDIVESLRYE